jgi:hypothetical protein
VRTAIVVGAAVVAALGGGIAIAANAPAPRQATTTQQQVPSVLVGITPVRVLDTRNAAGGPIGISPGHKLGAGETIDVAIAGVGAIPKNATSVAVNVTIDQDATVKSFLTVWPTGQTRPNTSTNNAEPGLVEANSAIFELGTDGKLSVFNQLGSVNVIIDVTGFFVACGPPLPTSTSTTTPGSTTSSTEATTTTSSTLEPTTTTTTIEPTTTTTVATTSTTAATTASVCGPTT